MRDSRRRGVKTFSKRRQQVKLTHEVLLIGANTSGIMLAEELSKKYISFQVIDHTPSDVDAPLLLTYSTMSQLSLLKHVKDVNLQMIRDFWIGTAGMPDRVKVRIDRALGVTTWLTLIDYVFRKLPSNVKPRYNVKVRGVKRHSDHWEISTSYRNYRVRYLVLAVDLFPKPNLEQVLSLLKELNLQSEMLYPVVGFLKVLRGRYRVRRGKELRNVLEMLLLGKHYGYAMNVFLRDGRYYQFLFNLNLKPQQERKWYSLSDVQATHDIELTVEEETDDVPLPIAIGTPFINLQSLPENLILVGEITGSSNPIFLYNIGVNATLVKKIADLISNRVNGHKLREELKRLYEHVVDNNYWAFFVTNLLFKFPMLTLKLFGDKGFKENFRELLLGDLSFKEFSKVIYDKARQALSHPDALMEMNLYNQVSSGSEEGYSLKRLYDMTSKRRKAKLRRL